MGERGLADHLEAHGWQSAPLDAAERAACAYAEKLTREPQEMDEEDLAPLRTTGFDDRAIHDLCQIVSYFNYINRIADGLGVDPEPMLE